VLALATQLGRHPLGARPRSPWPPSVPEMARLAGGLLPFTDAMRGATCASCHTRSTVGPCRDTTGTLRAWSVQRGRRSASGDPVSAGRSTEQAVMRRRGASAVLSMGVAFGPSTVQRCGVPAVSGAIGERDLQPAGNWVRRVSCAADKRDLQPARNDVEAVRANTCDRSLGVHRQSRGPSRALVTPSRPAPWHGLRRRLLQVGRPGCIHHASATCPSMIAP
jgi:hypothetical protein